MLIKNFLAFFTAIAFVVMSSSSFAEGEGGNDKRVKINSKIFSITVTHEGEKVEIKRNQDRTNEIDERYRPTYRGNIQAMNPFKPHQVETIGEIEMLEYLQQKANGDENILIIDSRTARWVEHGMIPSAINISFKEFEEEERTVEIMEEKFGVVAGNSALEFTYAKTLVMYCNGPWCGQSPIAIKKLLRLGYPAAKIKYYRGGMQNWAALGLTTVTSKPEEDK